MAKHLFLAFTTPRPGREAEFNAWYDETHLEDVLRIDGIVAAQRFRVEPKFETPDMLPGYLAIYEVDVDDHPDALEKLSERAGTALMQITEALDPDTARTFLCTALTDRVVLEPKELRE